MSLASFHLIFVAVSVLVSLGVGVVGVRDFVAETDFASLAYGVPSLLLVPVLLIYGFKVWRKLKDLGAFVA